MKRANPEQSNRYRFQAGCIAAIATAALACFPAVSVPSATAATRAVTVSPSSPLRQAPAQVRPNIAGEVEEKKGGGEKEESKPAAPNKRRQSRQKQPTRPPAPSYEVTFKTDIPEAEIFVGQSGMNMQSLGKTDAEGKLTTRITRGTYNILASRPGYQIQRQRVEVRSGTNSFNFNLELPATAKKKESEEEKPAEAEPTPTPEVAEQPADPLANAQEIINRYLNAKETAGITAKDWQLVRELTNAALDKEPNNALLKAQALAADGQIAYLARDYATALIAFKQAVLAAPELALAHYALGNAYLSTNQPAEAFQAYSQAAAINKEMALAYQGLGDALVKQNKTKEAAQYYNRAKSFGQPLPTDIGLASARDLKKRKRWTQALKEFQDVAATQPTAEVYVEIGDCYIGLEQPLSASQAYRKAIELDPKSSFAHYKFGDVMAKLNEHQSAMEAFERALALDPEGKTINRKRAREMANEAAKKIKKTD